MHDTLLTHDSWISLPRVSDDGVTVWEWTQP